jgi:hypothetical protein
MTPSLSRRRVVVGSAAVAVTVAAAGIAGKPTAVAVGPISQAALKEDFALWRLAVLQRHPRFLGQTALDAPAEAAFVAAEAAIGKTMTHRDDDATDEDVIRAALVNSGAHRARHN